MSGRTAAFVTLLLYPVGTVFGQVTIISPAPPVGLSGYSVLGPPAALPYGAHPAPFSESAAPPGYFPGTSVLPGSIGGGAHRSPCFDGTSQAPSQPSAFRPPITPNYHAFTDRFAPPPSTTPSGCD